VGNFERISFNFGPTLAAWLEKFDPATHQLIVDSDRANFARYGYGNAIAQNYNHVIAPLGKPSDTRLQIEWGITDFEQRFGHRPDGMWLAETACSTDVLQMMAEAGIKFTVLAPWQANAATIETIDPQERATVQLRLKAQRQRQAEVDVLNLQAKLRHDHYLNYHEQLRYAEALKLFYKPSDEPVPEPYRTSEPYLVELANGYSIMVFFYNGHLSSTVSFDGGATLNADNFVQHWLMPSVEKDKLLRQESQILLIATDGELYGHHQRERELFLEYLTRVSAPTAGMEVTFLRHYLEKHPPRRRIRIVDNTSWSCHHGVLRWSTGCGCTPDDASWKGHLRQAFDIVATEADQLFEREGTRIFKDSQAALREYIRVWLGHQAESDFLKQHLQERVSHLAETENSLAHRLLQAQMYKHQMYTSCAWFFEDIDRIEPKNALAAASITLRLLGRMVSSSTRKQFQEELRLAHSNRPTHFNGLQLYIRGLRRAKRLANTTSNTNGPTVDAAELEVPGPFQEDNTDPSLSSQDVA
jgi:alpha-amylase/alpha-mannosidase (GH57 family)